MRTSRAIISIAAIALVAACASAEAVEQRGAGDRAAIAIDQAGGASSVVAASWHLGMLALRAGTDDAGSVVSPSSLVSALAMVGEGSTSEEAEPFDKALGASGDERTDAVNALLTALERYDGDPALAAADKLPEQPMVHTAQRVVIDDQAEPAQRFLDRLQQGYGAGVLVTDLGSKAGVEPLSSWINEQTGGLIKKSAIVPDPSIDLVIQDSVVLAAAWEQPFDPSATSIVDFTVPGVGPVSVDTMSDTKTISTVSVDGWQAVRLPYSEGLVADLYLPPVGSEMADDPAASDEEMLIALSGQLDSTVAQPVQLQMPVLDMTSKTDLMAMLGDLGIADHDLTGIRADGSPVVVTQAVQQAVLKVAEDGTRAAAVTEIAVGATAIMDPPEVVHFDRPFLFVVRDTETGWPLFMASVVDPR